jgi:hypothetical protein
MAKVETSVKNFSDILDLISVGIESSANEEAIKLVVAKRKQDEIQKRADILEKGMDSWTKLKREINSCRPDVVNHVQTGGEDAEFVEEKKFSDAKFKELKGLKEKLVKLEAALLLALGEKQDYEKLASAIK